MKFIADEIFSLSIMLLFYKAVHLNQKYSSIISSLKNPAKSMIYLEKALSSCLPLLEFTNPVHLSNIQKIRLFMAKLKIENGEFKEAKDLLFDNLRDGQVEGFIRISRKNDLFQGEPKTSKCVYKRL